MHYLAFALRQVSRADVGRQPHRLKNQRLALAFIEVKPAPVQHNAHQRSLILEKRRLYREFKPDAPLIVGIQGAALEVGAAHQIKDAARQQASFDAVVAHQRMLEKMPINAGDLVGTQPNAGQAHHLAMAGQQIADPERRQRGGHVLVQRQHQRA